MKFRFNKVLAALFDDNLKLHDMASVPYVLLIRTRTVIFHNTQLVNYCKTKYPKWDVMNEKLYMF